MKVVIHSLSDDCQIWEREDGGARAPGAAHSASELAESILRAAGNRLTGIEFIHVACTQRNACLVAEMEKQVPGIREKMYWVFGLPPGDNPQHLFQVMHFPSVPRLIAKITDVEWRAVQAIYNYRKVMLSNNITNKRMEAAYCEHPLWPLSTVLPSGDARVWAFVLTAIVDPRAYRHPFRPGRLTRLFRAFSVDPDTFSKVLAGERIVRPLGLFNCWTGQTGVHQNPSNLSRPEFFLFRSASRKTDVDEPERALAKFVTRGSKRFLTFLNAVWLPLLSSNRELDFVPERFFKKPEEVSWYKKSVAPLFDRSGQRR